MGFAFFVPRAAAGHGSYIKKGKGKNMIIVLKANRSKEQVKNFISDLTDRYDVSVNTWSAHIPPCSALSAIPLR